VVGAGPAGLSAALGFLNAGVDVTVYEQRDHWNGRVCGAFLNPEAVRHLTWLGLANDPRVQQATHVTAATLHDHHGRQKSIPIRNGESVGLALSRKDLEEILLDAVRKRGGHIFYGSRIKEPPIANAVVLASGRFTHHTPGTHGWYGWNALFHGIKQAPGTLSLHFYPGGYVGVITFSDGSSNVCGLFKRTKRGPIDWESTHANAYDQSPSLRKLLQNTSQASPWKGVGPLPFSRTMQKSEYALLVGDAAAVGDPYMGEGIGRALSAGPMIHAAWISGEGENLNARYRKLWQNHYAPRLKLGLATRLLLGSSPFFQIAMKMVFAAPGPLQRALPIFHGGFTHGSHLSYS
jgi:flavin-dependent dehydrogenase